MRSILIIGLLLLAASSAAARPSTLDMTCQQAADLIASEGAITLTTGANTFDRFVTRPGSCRTDEHAEDGYAPTSDQSRCHLFYICKAGRTRLQDFD